MSEKTTERGSGSMNKIVLVGRLVRDPEIRYSQSGVAVTTFTLAVDRRFKNAQGEREADFIQVKSFKQLAELVANYLLKGKQAAVSGSLQISSYTDKEGIKKYSTDVMADDIQFLSPKSEQVNNNTTTGQSKAFGHEVELEENPFN